MRLNIVGLIVLIAINFNTIAETPTSTPCTGSSILLPLIDRPTYAFSACVVPEKMLLIESGYQYQKLLNEGFQHNLPNAEIRVGLPNQFEFELFVPNYIHQTVDPHTGFSPTAIGVKHIIRSDTKSVMSLLGVVIPPSGSASFGSKGVGGTIIGILAYDLTEAVSLSGMLGLSSQTLPVNEGGQRYSSVNPNLVLSWNKNKVSIYGELNGQSKTAPQEGSGFNMDVGLIYLIKKNICIDVEFGKRISGSLYNFNQYFGTGVSILFN